MTTPINLNKARKARSKADDKARADQNAVKFGQTKAQRLLNASQTAQATTRLNALRFDDE